MPGSAYHSKDLNHHGLVAGICDELGVVEIIDGLVGPTDRLVSVGQAVKAMILNGLGFVGRPLYLMPEFFTTKPVSWLLGEGIEADHLNDDSLGRALDILFDVGITVIYAAVAAVVVKAAGIRTRARHLDSTTLSFHGEYEGGDEEMEAIDITYGYSRDKRPDLKQAVVSMITTHEGALPQWLTVLSGNTADSGSFPAVIRQYVEQLEDTQDPDAPAPYLVADAALYSKNAVLQLDEVLDWICRVPASVGLFKDLIAHYDPDSLLPLADERYRAMEIGSLYGGVPQRWLLVYSGPQAKRDRAQLDKRIAEDQTTAAKQLRKLGRQSFETREAAQAALDQVAPSWRFHRPHQVTLTPQPVFKGRGRPKRDQEPDAIAWKLKADLEPDDAATRVAEKRIGLFVLATSELDAEQLGPDEWLQLYKDQASTAERGFRFLKDPLFFAHSLFLKTPSRIMALLMVMGLCLLIYSYAEHKLRTQLVTLNQTLPDQKGKPTQRITMRRVFQIFEGIHVLHISGPDPPQQLILNIHSLHHQILDLLGASVQRYYVLEG